MREAKTSEKLRRSEQHGKLRRLVQRSPKQTIVVVLLLVAIKYWQIALIAGAAILLVSFVIGLFKPKEMQVASPEVAPGADAQPTAESTEAMSAQVAEQNRQRQIQIDADNPRN